MEKNERKNNIDQELIYEIINNNNQKAQNILYDKYKTYITNYLRKKYNNYYDIEDDVSEILVKVFLNLNKYDKCKSSFNSWIFTIIKNHMIDKWRSNDISYNLTTNNSGNYVSSPSLNIKFNDDNNSFATHDITMENIKLNYNKDFENSNIISYLKSEMSISDSMLLDMKYIYGYNYTEIGKEMNLSSSTVSNRVNYVKGKLKEKYQWIY